MFLNADIRCFTTPKNTQELFPIKWIRLYAKLIDNIFGLFIKSAQVPPMAYKITPCIALGINALKAAGFYTDTFPNSSKTGQDEDGITVNLWGTSFRFLFETASNPLTTALSFFVYCGSEAEINRLYDILADNGNIILPLGPYPWTARYAWVQDRYGISWHLDVDDIRVEQKIVPTLIFAEKNNGIVRELVQHYVHNFPNSRILMELPYPESSGHPKGTLLFAQCKLNHLVINVMKSISPHPLHFTEGNFLSVCSEEESMLMTIQKNLTGTQLERQEGCARDPFQVPWAFGICPSNGHPYTTWS